MKRVSIRDVAKAAETSIASVSRCLNNISGVSPIVQKRVVEAARSLNYHRAFRRPRMIAVIFPALASPNLDLYMSQVIDALRKGIAARGYGCLMISPEDLELLNEPMLAGAVSFDFLLHVGQRMPLLKNIPLVCFNDVSNPLEQVCNVHSNEYQGVELAMRHLHENNHSRIGLLYCNTDLGNKTTACRVRAFLDVAKSLNIENLVAMQEWSNELILFEAVGMLLRKNCTALIAAGESSEMMTIYTLKLFGKRIPEDVSLITYENTWSRYQTPRQTTIGQDFAGLAAQSLDLLECMARGEGVPPEILVDYRLNVRESVRNLRLS